MIEESNFDEKLEQIAKTVVIGGSMKEFYDSLHEAERQAEIEINKESIRELKIILVICAIASIIGFLIAPSVAPYILSGV